MHSVLQEAILRLSGVVNLEQLEEAVKDALEAALPNTVSTLSASLVVAEIFPSSNLSNRNACCLFFLETEGDGRVLMVDKEDIIAKYYTKHSAIAEKF